MISYNRMCVITSGFCKLALPCLVCWISNLDIEYMHSWIFSPFENAGIYLLNSALISGNWDHVIITFDDYASIWTVMLKGQTK